MKLQGINHLTFSVSNLARSVRFYQQVFGADLLVQGNNLAYFSLAGIWIALNVETDIPRSEIHRSYTHIAFSVAECDFANWLQHLNNLRVNILSGRPRHPRDGKSVYFTDPDGHKFELHTGNLTDRMEFYTEEKNHIIFRYKSDSTLS